MKKIILGLCAACALALAVNMLWVDSETRPAEARDGGRIIKTGVARANVEIQGAGPAIVLIHGFGAAIDWWDDIAPDLARDHRVIRVDLIGHGGTEAPKSGYAIERQAALVSTILDELGVDRVTVIGHSMGGEVATALAERNPARIEGMILIDSPAVAGTSFTVMTNAYMDPLLGQFLSHLQTDRAIRRGLAQGFAPGFPIPEKFVADFRQLTYDAFRDAHEESIAYRQAEAPWERIAALKPVPPFLAIFGSRDAIVPPDHAGLFARVPGARVVMIDGAGHSPMVEKPAETLDAIRSFQKSWAGSAAKN